VGLDPALTLPTLVAGWARRDPGRPFLVEAQGETATYGSFHDGILRWGAALRRLGIGPGDRVASFLPPSIDAHLLWLAAACIGAHEVPINPELVGDMLHHVINDSGAGLSVVPDATPPPPTRRVITASELRAVAAGVEPVALDRYPGPGDVACVIYTSGTTGPAKGAVVPWGQITSTIGRLPRSWLSGDDAVYAPWPMFHVTGRSPLPSMADVGGRVVLRPRVSVSDFWHDIVTHGCTSTTVGALAPVLLGTEVPAAHPLRWVFMAPRGRLSLDLQHRWGVRVVGNYGSTEMGFPILNRRLDERTAHLAGWLRPGYEAVVVDGEGRPLPDGTAGELWIRAGDARVMFSGYVGVGSSPFVDGWFRTGDAMVRHPDGGFEFVDRLHDTIRRFGENISASAVEAATAALASITACAAVPVASAVAGQEVLLAVVAADPAGADPAGIYDQLRTRLPRHALPGYIAVRPSLPTTATGKVRKGDLGLAPGDEGVWESPSAATRWRRSPPGAVASRADPTRVPAAPRYDMADSITITDNRTGDSVEIPIQNGGVSSNDWRKLLPNIWFHDEALMTTAMTESAITYLDGDIGILRYRGYPIEQLAAQSTYLEVAYLLIHGELPNEAQYDAWKHDITYHTFIHENVRKRFLEGFHYDAHPMGMLVSAIAALSTFYLDAKDIFDPESRQKQIVRLIAKMPTLAAAAHRFSVGMPFVYPDNSLGFAENFLSMMWKIAEPHYEPDPRLARALDLLFILHADHEQNCGTTAMRTVGSAHADPYSAAAAAAAALYGPRHGGANEAVLRMLHEIGSIENVPAFIESVKAGKGLLQGFGHRVYKNYDPRAKIIKAAADQVFEVTGKNPLLDIALKLEEVALSDDYFISRKLYPNVDFYSGLIYQAMGFPIEMFTVLFAIPRTSGWLAHWVELLEQDQKIVRPRQIYVGEDERAYVPLAQRG